MLQGLGGAEDDQKGVFPTIERSPKSITGKADRSPSCPRLESTSELGPERSVGHGEQIGASYTLKRLFFFSVHRVNLLKNIRDSTSKETKTLCEESLPGWAW